VKAARRVLMIGLGRAWLGKVFVLAHRPRTQMTPVSLLLSELNNLSQVAWDWDWSGNFSAFGFWDR